MNNKILVPKNLELESRLLYDLVPDFDYEIDVFYYLVWYILRNPYHTGRRNDTYLALCADGLQKNVHRDYHLYLDHLDNLGLIEKLYSIDGSKCIKYRLTDSLLYAELEYYEISYWPLVKKMRNESKLDKKAIKKYTHLTKFLTNGKLTFNSMWARQDLNSDLDTTLINKNLKEVRKYHASMISCMNFDNGYWWIKNNPESDNRLHTNLTNMPSNLREYLTYDGEQLVNIDIKNSQPLFLYILIEVLRKSSFLFSEGVDRGILWGVVGNVVPPSVLLNIVKMAETVDTKELECYREWVLEGIYEKFSDAYITQNPNVKPPYIQSVYDHSTDSSNKVEHDSLRSFIKVSMFEIYFSSNKKHTTFKNLFATLFPTINNLITLIKSEDHVLLSRIMQHIEAFTVLEYVTKQIHKEHGIPQFTIHDSILTTASNGELVFNEFKRHFKDLTGVTPSLSLPDDCTDCKNEIRVAA